MSSGSPGRLATQKSKRGKTDDRIADDVRVVILLVGQGWLHMIGAILFPAGVAIVVLKGDSFIAAPIAMTTIRDPAIGAVRGDRVPDLSGLKRRPARLQRIER